MKKIEVCRESGMLPSVHCENIDTVWIPLNSSSHKTCPYHETVHLSTDNKYIVNSDCYPVHEMEHKSWFVLPPVIEWYYKAHSPFYAVLPPVHPKCTSSRERKEMQLIYPRSNEKVFVPYDASGEKQLVVFEAAHSRAGSVIYWHIDNTYIGKTESIHQFPMDLTAGNHVLTLVDDQGGNIVRKIEVLE